MLKSDGSVILATVGLDCDTDRLARTGSRSSAPREYSPKLSCAGYTSPLSYFRCPFGSRL